jgi:4-amino-4-deoxy-L-arabinose transferase-like glycosyltransferase
MMSSLPVPYPAFLGAVFRIAPRYDFWIVRLLQAIIDSLTAVLIWRLARRLVSPVAGWWAAGIWGVYGAAIYKCGELNTEICSIALGTLLIWVLVRAHDDPRRGRLWLAGALGAALVLTKASAALLFPVLLIGWLWSRRRKLRESLPQALVMAMAFVVVIAPWLLIVWLRFHTLSLRDPAYAGANLRSSNVLESEGYDLDLASADFWTYPVWRGIRDHPIDYAKLYLRKFYRMWGHASDEYRRGFPLGLTGEQWAHRIVVLLALFGVFLWPVRAGPVAAIPLAGIAYFAGLHMVMHVVSRYNLVAMPFVSIAAVLGGQWLLAGAGATFQGWRHGSLEPCQAAGMEENTGLKTRGTLSWKGMKWTVGTLTVAVVFGGMYAGISLLRPATWMLLDSLFSWERATWAFWIAGSVIVAGGILLLNWQAGRRGISYHRIGACVPAILLLIFWTQAVPREGHADWLVRLDRPGKIAQRVVTFPDWLVRDSIEAAFVSVDMVVDARKNCEVTMSLDGFTQRLPAESLVTAEYSYRKPAYSVFMAAYGDRFCDVPQWVVLPLDSAIIDSILTDRRLTIALSAQPVGPNPGGVTLHGDLPVRDYHHWIGPSFSMGSVERYYEGDDPRIWAVEPLDFKTALSEIVIDGAARTDDLSDRCGRQIGQYRMVIRIVKPCGVFVNF